MKDEMPEARRERREARCEIRGARVVDPASGRNRPGSIYIVDGKIAEHWFIADMLGLMQQLGAVPTPG